MFRVAIQAVLQDDGFKFPSPSSTEALHIASQLLPWCSDAANADTMTAFVSQFFEMFDRCVVCGTRKPSHSKHIERIWGTFHTERCSPSYKSSWSAFLKDSVQHPKDSPIFYQFITDHMFKISLKQTFSIEEAAHARPASSSLLSCEENNCLRYVAGALFRCAEESEMVCSAHERRDAGLYG